MNTELTEEEKFVRKKVTEIYPQIIINAQKTAGAAYDKYGHDLIGVVMEFFFDKPVEYQLKVINDGKLENFLTKLMAMQLKLGTTRFYHHYRKFHEKQREFLPNYEYGQNDFYPEPFQDEPDILNECIKKSIDELEPYKKMLVTDLVIHGDTYKQVSERYNIQYGHLKRDLTKVLKDIRNKCKHLQ